MPPGVKPPYWSTVFEFFLTNRTAKFNVIRLPEWFGQL